MRLSTAMLLAVLLTAACGGGNDTASLKQLQRVTSGPLNVVLLSPGCASFGMFCNEFHRGEEFRRLVNEL